MGEGKERKRCKEEKDGKDKEGKDKDGKEAVKETGKEEKKEQKGEAYGDVDTLSVEEWVRELSLKTPALLEEEWTKLRGESRDAKRTPSDRTNVAFLANPTRSRFTNIACWDQTRVQLKNPAQDFIHANFIDGLDHPRKWIVTQGPLHADEEVGHVDTIGDFWSMVWEQEARVIIMLCQEEEGGYSACGHYYPTEAQVRHRFDPFAVTCKEVEEVMVGDHSVVESQLILQKRGVREYRELTHYQNLSWPDKQAPASMEPLLDLLSKAEKQHGDWCRKAKLRPVNVPLVIHCSAGVGRSVTLVGVDIGWKMLERDGRVPLVPALLRRLRRARKGAVQSLPQYAALHAAFLIAIQRSPILPLLFDPPFLANILQNVVRPLLAPALL